MIITRYRIQLQCKDMPFPFETRLISALTEASAIKKAKYEARICGLEPTRVLACEIDSRYESDTKAHVNTISLQE